MEDDDKIVRKTIQLTKEEKLVWVKSKVAQNHYGAEYGGFNFTIYGALTVSKGDQLIAVVDRGRSLYSLKNMVEDKFKKEEPVDIIEELLNL